ncbi:MAG: DUF4214 domain-containing protein [Lachnospiraceae bacterium]|nr:DUF4214 domain-containing protein [Lachnospiraceae bacterium]
MSKKRMKKTLQTITTLLLTAIVVFSTFGMDLPVLAKGIDDDAVIVEDEDTVDVDVDAEEDIDADVEEDIDADVDEDVDADVDEDVDADVDENVDADVDEDVEADVDEDVEADVDENADVDEDIEAEPEISSEKVFVTEEEDGIDAGLGFSAEAHFISSEEDFFDGEEIDADELLYSYIDANISDEDSVDPRYASSLVGDRLPASSKPLYNAFKQATSDIAKGKRSSTTATINPQALGWNRKYTAAELGVSSLISGYSVSEEAMRALDKKIGFDKFNPRNIVLAVMEDCPYERYWMGLSWNYVGLSGVYYRVTSDKNYIYLDFGTELGIKMTPSRDFAGSESFTVDTSKTKAVNSAISKANTIVKDAKSKTDLQKITYYKDQICALNTYNHAVVNWPSSMYGNPWQLVYVFDGDPNTNVVCEGYSKAFMYLCEKTNFSDSEIACYTVSGEVYFPSNHGPHMWNIIHWNNNKNYLVDVTNVDGGNPPDLFFATPTSGSVASGYTFKMGSASARYEYDEDTLALYTTKQLTIGKKSSGKLSNIYVNYDLDILSNKSIPFTVIREGGSDNTKFKVASIKDANGNATMAGDYSTKYQKDNIIKLTFYSAGTYTIKFTAKDTDGTTKSQSITVTVKKGKVDRAKVEKFVSRFYTIILGRDPEKAGLKSWTDALCNGKMTGCDVALGFIRSEEFLLKQTSNGTYVKKLYKAFFNRAADDAGYKDWTNQLKKGASREQVLAGFVNSAEFKKLCTSYGIRQGYLDYTKLPPLSNWNASKASDAKIKAYVKRLYTVALGRTPSTAEVNSWTKTIKNGKDANGNKYNAAQVASRGFFESPEYTKKKKSDEAFIKDAYKAMFGRDADAEGLKHWKTQLKNGMPRRTMLEEGFGNSTEFIKLMESYGFVRVP